MKLLQNRKVFMTNKSTIWENTDRCDDKYRCATALYLSSMLSHVYNIVIDSDVGAPGYGEDFINGLNSTNKRFLSMLMITVQLLGAATNNQ